MKLNITFIIPLLLVLSSLGASIFTYKERITEAEENIRRDALSALKLDISRLQNILYNLLTERSNNIDEARLNLSVTAMDPSIRTILLTDDSDMIILSNRYLWEGSKASTVSKYSKEFAHEVRKSNTPKVFFNKKNSSILEGYYPVILQLEQKGGYSRKRVGILHAEVSIQNKLASEKARASNISLLLAGIMLSTATIVAILLHFWVSRRIGKLMLAAESLAKGDLNARSRIKGNDELTLLGNTLDTMASRIKSEVENLEAADDKLRTLNEMLEHKVEERTSELEEKRQELLDSQAKAHNANKMAALGEMASGIAHEINSPLQAIKFFTYILRKKAGTMSTEEAKETAAKIEESVDTAADIIESLRKVSRDSANDLFEEVGIRDIIHDATGITTERYKLQGISLKTNFHGDTENETLFCQRLQLSQVLINILNNAYDAILGLKEKWISIDIYDLGDRIKISVTDSGPGIPQSEIDRIFEPMYTTKDIGKGTGLGLSISREILLRHEGSLSIETDNVHTCFVLIIPKH